MIDVVRFTEALEAQGVRFFAGVPDSLLRPLCAHLSDTLPLERHVTAANEGAAVALAAGAHLGTGEIPAVYMQNSGQGNALNPLISLCARQVYAIPMLLIVGWRGEPDRPDEPQHRFQGQVTRGLFDLIGLPHVVLSSDEGEALSQTADMLARVREQGAPGALVVPKGCFVPVTARPEDAFSDRPLTREEAISQVVEIMGPDALLVSTTGKASRELFELREARGEGHGQDFLCVGSMGHAASIAAGVALRRPARRVVCLDGDGAALMHMGAMATIGALGRDALLTRLLHVLINNGAHESVGGQPTAAREVDLPRVAEGCGYRAVRRVTDAGSLHEALTDALVLLGPAFIEVVVRQGSRPDLGRPTTSPAENRDAFMETVTA
jgi:phosphonopyruvate decarboxylase